MYDQGRHSRIQPARHSDRPMLPFTEVRLWVKQQIVNRAKADPASSDTFLTTPRKLQMLMKLRV
jgi:hypothetical protein